MMNPKMRYRTTATIAEINANGNCVRACSKLSILAAEEVNTVQSELFGTPSIYLPFLLMVFLQT